MRFGSFRYLVKQGWKNMGANRLMTFASVGVLTACFIITGLALLVFVNVDNIVDFMAGQNEITVVLREEIDDAEQAAGIEAAIKAIPNVDGVRYMSKDEVYQDALRLLENYAGLLEGLGYDKIFPARFFVTVEDLNYIDQTNSQLLAVTGVETTYMEGDLADVLITIKNGVTYGGLAIVAILAAVSVIVIVNTIRLTVFARRREISIMKYVGATNAFIRLPFFVEGVTVGIIAGAVSSGLLCGGYYLVYDFLQGMYNMWVLGILGSIYPLSDIWHYIVLAALAGGVVLGGIGTALSVRKHLKV